MKNLWIYDGVSREFEEWTDRVPMRDVVVCNANRHNVQRMDNDGEKHSNNRGKISERIDGDLCKEIAKSSQGAEKVGNKSKSLIDNISVLLRKGHT